MMTISYIDSSIYDKIFEDFSTEDASYIEDILNKFLIKTEKRMKILDVGCGTGRIGKILSRRFYIIGLDIDLNMLKIAKTRIDVICCDISHIPIRASSIDAAYSWLATLNYLTYSKLREHIEEMSRILKIYSTYIVDIVLDGFNENYYEESWSFKYNDKECTFRYSVKKLEKHMWLETFKVNCNDVKMERSFVTYVYPYERFRNIVDNYFKFIIYRPFTFNRIIKPAGRCVIVLAKKESRETVL